MQAVVVPAEGATPGPELERDLIDHARDQIAHVKSPPRHTGIRARSLPVNASEGFDLGHVHDITNSGASPAVSVHAYAPPLTAMSYYRVDPHGGLRRTRTVLVGGDTAPVESNGRPMARLPK